MGSVTEALHDVNEGGDMSSRLYEFIKVKIETMVRRCLSRKLNRIISKDDIYNRVQFAAFQSARKQKFKSREDFATWCVKVAKNQISSEARKEFGTGKRRRQFADDPAIIEGLADRKQLTPEQQEIIDSMLTFAEELVQAEKDDFKRAALCLFFNGVSNVSEICRLLEQHSFAKRKSESTIRKMIDKAIVTLAQKLKEELGDVSDFT